MQAITLDVILRAVFGVEDGARRDGLRRTIRALLSGSDSALGTVMTLVAGARAGSSAPAGGLVGALDAPSTRRSPSTAAAATSSERDDILSLLMQARDEDGEPMGDAELRDELVTLLLAGHETTATSLAWAFERLVRHPAALERLGAEARDGERGVRSTR